MGKQQTKSERLETFYRQARMDLPRHQFTEFLCFAWGIFEAVTRFGRPVNHGDLSLIEKELKDLLGKAGFKKQECQYCGKLSNREFCNDLHAIKYQMKMDREVEQESRMAGKGV